MQDKKRLTRNLTIRFTEEEIREIEKMSNKLEIPKTTFARNLLIIGLEDIRILNNLGILMGVKKAVDFKEKLTKIIKEKENKQGILIT